MAEPTQKSSGIEALLNEMAGRTPAIKTNRCVMPPIGCDGPATEFRNWRSEREYRISGLCQNCQDEIFGKD